MQRRYVSNYFITMDMSSTSADAVYTPNQGLYPSGQTYEQAPGGELLSGDWQSLCALSLLPVEMSPTSSSLPDKSLKVTWLPVATLPSSEFLMRIPVAGKSGLLSAVPTTWLR